MISTDHAPHHVDEKLREFDMAPFGISGLETALSLSLKLVQEGILSLNQLVKKMALNPARILRIDKGTFKVEAERFASKGKNTPFEGWVLRGRPTLTISKGRVYE